MVRECSKISSNWRSKILRDYLKENNIVGIEGIDTGPLLYISEKPEQ